MRTHLVISALTTALLLAACQSSPKGIRVVNGGTSAIPAKEGVKIRDFSANEISSAIVGKSFQYTRADGNGFVTYNSDGTFDYQDDSKGAGTGQWSANGSEYCETFGAGAAKECGVFKNTGDAFFAANSRLVEMKI